MITIVLAEGVMRRQVERMCGPLASDVCVAVMVNAGLIGWGDDYGTFHPRDADSDGPLAAAAEGLLAAASDLWAVTS